MRARPAGVLGPRVEAGRTPQSPALRHAFTVRVEVAAPLTVGRTAAGTRRVAPITGGAVTGPHGSGRVLPVGADYHVVGTEVSWLEAKYVLELAEGHPVYVGNRAMRVASAEDSRAIAQGIPVDPQRVYFRCAPVLTADEDGPWGWLNRTVFVGSGERDPDRVRLEIFAVQ
ncbi:DUF3237 family protein [Kocuria marina]|uniref:DUF3237 family protein n=1 Tax=Kocuria marina TaxID=223184 RepID=UPI002989ECA9|nr:DUF3237 family protein [Kocuria marina]